MDYNDIISEHILECYRYRSDLNGTINQLLKYIPSENFVSLKDKLKNYDINSVWCKEFWKKYADEINDILNKNDNIMLFDDIIKEIKFNFDLNPSVYSLNNSNYPDFCFKKDIAGIWLANN